MERFTLTTNKEGPVQISPRNRNDLIWLMRNSMEQLPVRLSELKKANSKNDNLPSEFYKHFPLYFHTNLTFVDERAGPNIIYSEASKMAEVGEIPLGSQFMSCSADLKRKTLESDIRIYTRPCFSGKKINMVKWDEADMLYAIPSVTHELSHSIQSIINGVVGASILKTTEFWSHGWVIPLIFLEGYALTHEGANPVMLGYDVVFQPLLRAAIRWNHLAKNGFLITKGVIQDCLNSRVLYYALDNKEDTDNIWRKYYLSHFLYLSIIGLRSGILPDTMLEEFKSMSAVEASIEDMVSTPIKKKKEMFANPFPKLILDEADRVEVEMQMFYYTHYDEMVNAADDASQKYKNKEKAMPESVKNINSAMLLYMLKGFGFDDLVNYSNILIKEISDYGNTSPYANRATKPGGTLYRPISVYSDSRENRNLPVLRRKLFLD